MTDIYKAPSSNLDVNLASDISAEEIEERELLTALIKGQRVFVSIVLATVVTTALILAMSMLSRGTPILLLVVPAIVAGGIVKLVGGLVRVKYRALAGGFVGLVVFGLFSESLSMGAALSFLSAIVFTVVSRRRLSVDQERVLYKERQGRLQP